MMSLHHTSVVRLEFIWISLCDLYALSSGEFTTFLKDGDQVCQLLQLSFDTGRR